MAAPNQPASYLLSTYQSLLTTFSSFLTVAIHTILYERELYPSTTFITTRAYNFPIRQNRHPKVCQWINDAVTAVEAELLKGVVDKVAVVIYSKEGKVMERFMFDLSRFPVVPPEEKFTEFTEKDFAQAERDLKTRLVDVEEQLRGAVRKLAYCGGKLDPLPEDCTFTVVVELKDKADPPIGHPQPWMPSQPSLQTGDAGQSKSIGSDLGGVQTTPVRNVEAGEFVLEMWIEEGKAKHEQASQ